MEFRGFMTEFIRSELEDAVGTENVSSTKGEKLAYGTDYFWVSRMVIDKGGMPALPDLIVRPASAEEVSKVLKIANYYKIPVQTWGGGSGTQGGALPMAGGILLDVKRMDKLIDIDTIAGTITCETGMIFQTLEWYANEKGYSVMHLPSCLTCCTVGGALAHNGIGILSTKYGKIDDQCLSLEIVLPNGDIINTAPVPKHSSGPNLLNMFIGSEGTLGVMTKATGEVYIQHFSEAFNIQITDIVLVHDARIIYEYVQMTVLFINFAHCSSYGRLIRDIHYAAIGYLVVKSGTEFAVDNVGHDNSGSGII